MKKFAIIVAGGSGTRMKTVVPKQFLPLGDSYILMCTIQKFYQADHNTEIVLVLPFSQIAYWKKLCTRKQFTIKHHLAEGGATRFHSVKNGLKFISSLTPSVSDLVAIHDGVRPLVSVQLINKTYAVAQQYGNAIPATALNESLRGIKTEQGKIKSYAINRAFYRLIQTPQCISFPLLQKAYRQRYKKTFTDDASVLESLGTSIHLLEGEITNIKITTPEDMLIANTFWETQTSTQ